MQKTKKKRYKCEKNTKFSKMQKIKGFGAYSKMSPLRNKYEIVPN